jgi:SAM-dependent methyltransferase
MVSTHHLANIAKALAALDLERTLSVMTEHASHAVERHCDVAVVGGSAAGLAAALQLGRQRRSVIVVDAGSPRHAPAAHVHGYLGREGFPPAGLSATGREEVRSYGGEVLAGRVSAVTRVDGDRFRVELAGGHAIVARRVLAATGLVDLRPDTTGQTVIPGLYAAGTVCDPSQQAMQTAADGSRVGAMISFSLAGEDLRAAARPAANEADWDHRYGGAQIWSGNPNGTLVKEVSGMTPGRALDVGAGEGGDALWLAEQGWRVTANDISRRALDRVDIEAKRRSLHVQRHHADANSLNAFETAAFDLVSAQYASIPRTPDGRGVRNVTDAVAPGGTLLIVSHDLEAMRTSVDAHAHNPAFDPDAYVRTGDFLAVLTDSSAWDIEVNERRPRPAGAASASHHIEDVVLRARRRAG